jgi:hyperosmotically inducible protein
MYLKQSLAVMFAVALSAAACSSSTTPPNPTDRTETALDQANLKDVDVDWDNEARVAHLKGTVESTADRQRAEEVATAAVGTSGKVLNEVTIKDVTEHTANDADGKISSDLKVMVNNDQVLRDRDINFDVNNGVVTVKGEVRTAAEKNKVTELVRSEPGVKDMANSLEIKPKE